MKILSFEAMLEVAEAQRVHHDAGLAAMAALAVASGRRLKAGSARPKSL